jgi:hypothetical protein
VIFKEDKTQMKENNSTLKKNYNNSRGKYFESYIFESVPEHEEQEHINFKTFEIRRSTRKKRPSF